jgi:cytochrome c-type biogenesis protein
VIATVAETALANAAAQATVTDTVVSGPFVLAGLLALAAGVVSFASPCVVPLVPGYLSYLAGLVGADTAADSRAGSAAGTEVGTVARTAVPGRPVVSTSSGTVATSAAAVTAAGPTRVRWRAVGATCLFVAGFSLVFLAESALALGLYTSLIENHALLVRISGGIAIVMGLVLLLPALQREWRVPLRAGRRGAGRIWGAPVLGAAFGTGWLACTSPTLAGIIALASSTEWNGNAVRGLGLVLAYCAGLGTPFVLLSIGLGWAGTALAFLRRHARGIQLSGALVLVAIGLAMLTGAWGAVLSPLRGAELIL